MFGVLTLRVVNILLVTRQNLGERSIPLEPRGKGENCTGSKYALLICSLLITPGPSTRDAFSFVTKLKRKYNPQRETGLDRKQRWGLGVAPKPAVFIIPVNGLQSRDSHFIFPYAWIFLSAIKDAHRRCGSHGLFRWHLPGHAFETSLLFLWVKILQVLRWSMQVSPCEYEPINKQPHFMRLPPPNCFVSAANYFWEIFLPMEKESVIIIESTAKQKLCCKHIKGRDHIFSMF